MASFDHHDLKKIMAEGGQVSSRGAVGVEALKRSAEEDLTLDPIYNQLKMYSEIYRMLGWLRPTHMKSKFKHTLVGQMVSEGDHLDEISRGLLSESLLGITFPNPNVEQTRIRNHRPFPWILRLMVALDGKLTKWEMILGVMDVEDDLEPHAFDNAVERIRRVRGSQEALIRTVKEVCQRNGVQETTAGNYTRFPVGVMTMPQLGWGNSLQVAGLYERKTKSLVLTDVGADLAGRVEGLVDVRESHLEPFSPDERANFANVAWYAMLERAGFEALSRGDFPRLRDSAWRGAKRVLETLGIGDPCSILYSPCQQAPDEILELADSIDS